MNQLATRQDVLDGEGATRWKKTNTVTGKSESKVCFYKVIYLIVS